MDFEDTVLAGRDDPVWEYVLMQRLSPYIPYARRWWCEVETLAPFDTGIYAIEYYNEQLPGMYYRFTRTAVRSPIRGIQAFPFVVAAYLQLTGIKGGSTKFIQTVCLNGAFKADCVYQYK